MTDTSFAEFLPDWQPALTHSFYLRQLLDTRPDVARWLNEHWRHAIDTATMQASSTQRPPPTRKACAARCASYANA